MVLIGRNEKRLNETAEACKGKGAAVTTFICDLRDREKMEKFLFEEDDKAPIDLILAAAGVMIPQCGRTEDYAVVTRELFSINVDGTFNTILPLLNRMKERRSGQIALFSSGAGLCSQPMNPIYSPTKVTLMSYGEALRFAMREYNVYVNVVSPGAIKTAMTDVPYLESMQSSLASVEGMAKAIVYGLSRDFMHIGHLHIVLYVQENRKQWGIRTIYCTFRLVSIAPVAFAWYHRQEVIVCLQKILQSFMMLTTTSQIFLP